MSGINSSIDTVIPITLIHVKMEENARLVKQLESDLNGMIYVFSGKVTIDNPLQVKTHPDLLNWFQSAIRDGELALLTKGKEIIIQSETESEFLISPGLN